MNQPDKWSERGFALTELLVVVAILAVLTAIATATFLGARARSHDSAAQATVRDAIVVTAIIIADNDPVIPPQALLLAQLSGAEPGIVWKDSTQHAGTSEISVAQEPTFVTLASGSHTSSCFYARIYLDLSFDKHHASTATCRAEDGESVVTPIGW